MISRALGTAREIFTSNRYGKNLKTNKAENFSLTGNRIFFILPNLKTENIGNS
jgi:hypothetical protein